VSTRELASLGLGLGWRPELALMIERRDDLGFVEIIAEGFDGRRALLAPLQALRERGVQLVPHGVSLSLGGAASLDTQRLDQLARLAERCEAPLVSEHLCFTRAGGMESGHLLPLPYTREALDIVVAHIRQAQAILPVPLAVENIASLFEWPDAEMDEAQFITSALEESGALLLLDLENLYANHLNLGTDMPAFLAKLPLSRVAYVHVAGGFTDADGLYHDSHAHDVPQAVFELLRQLCERTQVNGVMIERDGRFPSDTILGAELDAVAALVKECREHEL